MMPKFTLLLLMLSLALLYYQAGAVENTTDYWANQAKELSSSGSDREAALAYEKALQYITVSDSKTQATTWIGKGDALSKAGKQALSDDSNGTSLLQLKAEAFFKQSKYDEALKANGAAIVTAAPCFLYAPTSWIGKGECPESSGKE